jgi:hypothetical protein
MDDPDPNDECAILSFGTARASLDEIAHLRKDPGPGRPKALEFQILKHADEQTVLALAALLHALAAFPHVLFDDWGVVAAPRWPGRFGTATALERYQADGARGVSPMAIPNVCLHSMSATISLAFAMRGPNFGVGGGLASVADGLLTGLGVQLEHRPPGTWVVLTEWEVEPGQTPGTPHAGALALALAPTYRAPMARRLCLQPSISTRASRACPRLASLTDHLLQPAGANKPWICKLDWGMELVLSEGTKA